MDRLTAGLANPQDAKTSLVQFVQSWLKDDLCGKDSCSSSVVTATYQKVSSDCSYEIEHQHFIPMGATAVLLVRCIRDPVDIIALTPRIALQNYENTRKAACLIDPVAKNNATSYCPTEILHNIETSGTPISYASLQKNFSNPPAWLKALPPWTYCTPCGSGLLNGAVMSALKVLDPDWQDQVKTTMEKQCGSESSPKFEWHLSRLMAFCSRVRQRHRSL